VTHRKDWTPEQRDAYGDGNQHRDAQGVIATLTDGTVCHRPGFLRDALRAVAEVADAREAKVVTVSTPRTILADLGIRATYLNGFSTKTVNTPEATLLGQIGRADLIAELPKDGRRQRRQRRG